MAEPNKERKGEAPHNPDISTREVALEVSAGWFLLSIIITPLLDLILVALLPSLKPAAPVAHFRP